MNRPGVLLFRVIVFSIALVGIIFFALSLSRYYGTMDEIEKVDYGLSE